MAIGITASALSILFALMLASTDNLATSADLSAEHRIFNRIIGEIRSEPWSEVDRFDGAFRFFTTQARSLPDSEKDSFERTYTAKIEVRKDEVGIYSSSQTRRIIVRVTHLPDYETAFSDNSRRSSFRTFSSFISSMEK